MNSGQGIVSGRKRFVQCQSFHGAGLRRWEQLTGRPHAEKPQIELSLREVRVSLGVARVKINRLGEMGGALRQIRRRHLVPEEDSFETSFISLRMDLPRRNRGMLSRVYQLMNLTGNVLSYLGL